MTLPRAPWPALVVVLLVAVAFALRIEAATRPGLWADEIFSLAMATGHSLEHPAAEADPALGDFIQPRDLEPPSQIRRYAEQDARPAGAGRVVRAVLRSDTSPPLYYLLLNAWTRPFGTGDAALRLFSVWWAVLSMPLLWLVAREAGEARAAWPATLLFAWSPVAIFYSAEGRMYSLLWALALALMWATLRLERTTARWPAALWVVAGVAGLLTHYFFAFVWLACLAWLWLAADPARRRGIAVLAGVTLLAVVPWYAQVPASLASWRVSGDWLDGALRWPGALLRPLTLAGSLLSGTTDLGGWRRADHAGLTLLALVAVFLLWQRLIGRMVSRRSLLLWGCLAAACTGPLVFDVLRHTTTTNIPRYVLPALPVAVLLAALGLSLLPRGLHAATIAVLLLAWLPGARAVAFARVPRPRQPYRDLDARLAGWARPGDVVIVRSIPSGAVGVARYLERDIPLAPWVVQLGTRRVPADVGRLLAGRRRVAVATIHNLGATDSLEPWLEIHARPLGRDTFPDSHAEVRYFAPAGGATAFPGAPAAWE
ncbi:MAG TPA: glycosyltransferase family 39 protein [Gemmatimonadales bacterium]|nr:glycosyltransferase family 39 protein [Gemmatimonadales bacterium]